MELVDDPELSGQTEVLPPKVLTVDGAQRRRNREVTPEEAVTLAGRGLRSFLVDFGFACEVTAEELVEVVTRYRSHFDGMGEGHPPEAWACLHGRRNPKTSEDTRIVVVTVLHMAESRS